MWQLANKRPVWKLANKRQQGDTATTTQLKIRQNYAIKLWPFFTQQEIAVSSVFHYFQRNRNLELEFENTDKSTSAAHISVFADVSDSMDSGYLYETATAFQKKCTEQENSYHIMLMKRFNSLKRTNFAHLIII